jgi:YaaC-like Protein
MLVLTYCLGMLSRYFPDVWMTVKDSRVEIAEVTNTLLGVIYRKFPNLILDQMTGIKHHIHS